VLERSLRAVRTRGEPVTAEVLSGAC
jgi:hypothetical protein